MSTLQCCLGSRLALLSARAPALRAGGTLYVSSQRRIGKISTTLMRRVGTGTGSKAATIANTRVTGTGDGAAAAASSGVVGAAPAAATRAAAEERECEFHETFQQQWGARWPALFDALAAPTRHVALHNAFLLRQLAPGELPGAAPLALRHPHLAELVAAVCGSSTPNSTAAAGNSNSNPGGNHPVGSSSRPPGAGTVAAAAVGARQPPPPPLPPAVAAAVQALHWDPMPPPGTSTPAHNDSTHSTPAATASISYPPPPADPATGLTSWYWLDPASLLPPLLLDVQLGQRVLDMCAAPGGKSLVLAQLLLGAEHAAAAADAAAAGQAAAAAAAAPVAGGDGSSGSSTHHSGGGSTHYSGSLMCNEIDAARRTRLVRVLWQHVPQPARLCIRVTPHDGARWWGRNEAESFDRVLLDAPCSSDRHVAQQAAARGSRHIPRSDWSLQRCRRIAEQQSKLLAAAVKCLRPGGRLVYSTCSIADLENDGVIDRVLQKAAGSLAVVSHTLLAVNPPRGEHASISEHGGSSSHPGAVGDVAAATAAAAEAEAGELPGSSHPGAVGDVAAAAAAATAPGAAAEAAGEVPCGDAASSSGGGSSSHCSASSSNGSSTSSSESSAAGQAAATAAAAMLAALEGMGAERTRHGWLVLPDSRAGAGPIYLAVLHKVASSDLRRAKVNKYAAQAAAAAAAAGAAAAARAAGPAGSTVAAPAADSTGKRHQRRRQQQRRPPGS